MYSGLKYLSQSIIDTLKGNNNELLGGFPHSEIVGSKPILGLPTLIAEYHVLHRLLLPRHPPNALLALDLIQKKTNYLLLRAIACRPSEHLRHSNIRCAPHSCLPTPRRAWFWSEVIHFPMIRTGSFRIIDLVMSIYAPPPCGKMRTKTSPG